MVISFFTKDLQECSFKLENEPSDYLLEKHLENVKYTLKKKSNEEIYLVIIWEDYNFIPYKDFKLEDIKKIWQK